MDRVEHGRTPEIRCANCGQFTPSYDVVNDIPMQKACRQLCSQCFNTEVAKSNGLDQFEHVRFDPVELADCTGEAHVFHFRTHLFGTGIALDAFELRDGDRAGYQFQIIADPGQDLLVLLGRLIEKIRRALAIQHVNNGERGLQISHQVVRGRIEWDAAEDGRVPLLVIDGRQITWDDLGRMMMSFEGCQFKLDILDISEES